MHPMVGDHRGSGSIRRRRPACPASISSPVIRNAVVAIQTIRSGLDHRNGIAAGKPLLQVDVTAAPRAERAIVRIRRPAADRTRAAGGSIGLTHQRATTSQQSRSRPGSERSWKRGPIRATSSAARASASLATSAPQTAST